MAMQPIFEMITPGSDGEAVLLYEVPTGAKKATFKVSATCTLEPTEHPNGTDSAGNPIFFETDEYSLYYSFDQTLNRTKAVEYRTLMEQSDRAINACELAPPRLRIYARSKRGTVNVMVSGVVEI